MKCSLTRKRCQLEIGRWWWRVWAEKAIIIVILFGQRNNGSSGKPTVNLLLTELWRPWAIISHMLPYNIFILSTRKKESKWPTPTYRKILLWFRYITAFGSNPPSFSFIFPISCWTHLRAKIIRARECRSHLEWKFLPSNWFSRASNLNSEFLEAKAERNWLIETPCWRSHQGTRNSRRFLLRCRVCHCTICRLLASVCPPPGFTVIKQNAC